MKSTWLVVAVIVSLAVASGAWAQGEFLNTARALGMGNVSVGVADDGAAWFQNPAGLGAMNLTCQQHKSWANDVIGVYGHISDSGNNHAWNGTWSGWSPQKAMGFGAGYEKLNNVGDVYGAGFGMALSNTPLSLGINIMRSEPDAGGNETLWNLGALYRFQQPGRDPIRVGLRVDDVSNKTDQGPQWDMGVAWPATDRLLVAVDALDITNKTDNGHVINAGVEYLLGQMNEWRLRVGTMDTGNGHKLTLGGGYDFANNVRVDVGYAKLSEGHLWEASAGYTF